MTTHRENRIVLVAAAWAAAYLAAGCGSSNPCDGKEGSCLAVHVTSTQVSELDQVALGVTMGDGKLLASIAAPATVDGLHTLPLDVPFVLPPNVQGSLVLIGIAYRSQAIIAEGYADVSVAAGDHRQVQLSLGPPLPDSTPDGGTDGGSGGGTAPQGTLLSPGQYELLSATRDGSYIAVVTQDAVRDLEVLDSGGRVVADVDHNLTVDPASNRSVGRLYTGGTLVYEVNPVPIGTLGKQSSSLNLWTPHSGKQQLGVGVPGGGAFAASRDGQIVAYARNISSSGSTADLAYVTVGGTPQTLATATAASWLSWQFDADGTLYALVDGTTPGQHDLLRAPRPASGAAVRVCSNCSDFVVSDDGATVAAIAAPVNGVGRVVLGSTALASSNALGTSTLAAPTADAAWLAGFVPSRQSLVYYAPPTGGGSAWDLHELDYGSAVTITPRVTGGSVEGLWTIENDWLAFATHRNANGALDSVDVLPIPSGTASPYAPGTSGALYAASPSGTRFTYVDETTVQASWHVEIASAAGGAATPLARLPAGSYGGTFVDDDTIVFYDLTDNTLAEARVSTNTFAPIAGSVASYSYAADARKLFYVVQGTAHDDGLYALTL